MKYITLIIGLLVMGCGKTEIERPDKTDTERIEDENRRLKAQLENDKLKAELEAKNKKIKDDILRLSVVGEYEHTLDELTVKIVLLENGSGVYYENGIKQHSAEPKWSISNGEIHVKDGREWIVFRINKDKGITLIAIYINGKRTDFQTTSALSTYKRLK